MMIQKLLIFLIVCYLTIIPIESHQSVLQNCQSENGTSEYDMFYEIKFGNTNGNELNVTVYIDDPREVNILLATKDRYNSEDKDNYEIVIVGGVPMIAFGLEPEKMSINKRSGGNVGVASPVNSPKKITIQVQNGAININIFGKTYSHKLPKVVNVKYLSFADFTANKNVFYFNCPDDCGDLSNSSSTNDNNALNELSPPEVPPNSISNEVFPPKILSNNLLQEENALNSGTSTELPSSKTSSPDVSPNGILQYGNSSSDNVKNSNNAKSEESKTFWQRLWDKLKGWSNWKLRSVIQV